MKAQVNSLTEQLKIARSRSSQPSDNTQHGSVRSAVLSTQKPKAGFDKNAWEPPSEDLEEQVKEQPAAVGFNKAAWAPPDGDTEE